MCCWSSLPLTQLNNTPYPSITYLTGFLQSQGIQAEQADLGIEMVLRLSSADGLRSVFKQLHHNRNALPKEARMQAEHRYVELIEPVIRFLQGQSSDLAGRLMQPGVLPQGPRFRGRRMIPRSVSVTDRAKQWATFFSLEDLAGRHHHPHFGLSRYAEHIGRSSSFDHRRVGGAAEPDR